MKNFYTLKMPVSSSLTDSNLNLKFDAILNVMQDVSTLHSYDMGVDYETLVKTSNAFWVLTKIKVKIERHIKSNELAEFNTYPSTYSQIRFLRNYKFTSISGGLINAKAEWCLLDYTTKSIRKGSTTTYPFDMEHILTPTVEEDFSKHNYTPCDNDYVYTYKILPTDIDVNNHTNNVIYCKMAINAYTLSEFLNLNFKNLELYFLNQSFEGDEIEIYKLKTPDGKYYVEGKKQDKKIFTALFN